LKSILWFVFESVLVVGALSETRSVTNVTEK